MKYPNLSMYHLLEHINQDIKRHPQNWESYHSIQKDTKSPCRSKDNEYVSDFHVVSDKRQLQEAALFC